LPTTAVGKLFKPALVEREIEETVRAEAKRVGAELSSVRVERDPHSGLRAMVAALHRAEALRDALDRYAFKSEVSKGAVLARPDRVVGACSARAAEDPVRTLPERTEVSSYFGLSDPPRLIQIKENGGPRL
jgi:hypothetical protein